MAEAAAKYPDIARITTDRNDLVNINGRDVQYHNTNRFVGQKGWEILLSKTGYTLEAGRCLIMRFQSTGGNVILVLLNAKRSAARTLDALHIRSLVNGDVVSVLASWPAKRMQHSISHTQDLHRKSVWKANAERQHAKFDSALPVSS